jgi:hypothetical protein
MKVSISASDEESGVVTVLVTVVAPSNLPAQEVPSVKPATSVVSAIRPDRIALLIPDVVFMVVSPFIDLCQCVPQDEMLSLEIC